MWCTVDIVKAIKPKFVIWENVKNLLSKKHIHNFNNYLEIMDNLGYNSYYKVLNAKDFGVPQNRERVYTISIRKDIDNSNFTFPNKQELTIRLKDILEDSVPDKFYLSDNMVKGFQEHNKNHTNKGTGFIWKTRDTDGIASALRANAALCPTDNTINVGEVTKNSQAGQVYSDKGISPTIIAGTHGYAIGNIIQPNAVDDKFYLTEEQINKIENSNFVQERKRIQNSDICDTLLARDYKDPKCVRVGGMFDKEKSKHQAGSVYDKDGLAPSLDSMQGGYRQPMVAIDNPLKGKSNYGWHFEQNVYGENSQCCRSVKAGNGSGNIPKIITIGNYSPSNHDASRIVNENGLAPTVKENHGTVTAVAQQVDKTNSKEICNTIPSIPKDNYVIEKYKKFAKENGYIPKMFNPYNNSEIEDIAPTQSTQCGSTTSSATVLIKETNTPNEDEILNAKLTEDNKNTEVENKIIYEEPLERKGWHRKACEVLNTDGISTCIHTQSNNLLQKIKVEERFFKQAIETCNENNCSNGDTIDAFNKKINTSGISPTVTTRPEGFKTAILPIQDYRIRKLTPKECWRLMRFYR